jgi:hypothetical protein
MSSLAEDLQTSKKTITEFADITARVLNHLPNVVSNTLVKNNYKILTSDIAGTTKFVRPINKNLFIENSQDFKLAYEKVLKTLEKIRNKKTTFSKIEKDLIDSTFYTIQQSIGAGLDLFVNPNSARKHVGNRFEELIKVLFSEIGVSNKKMVLQIPYETDEGQKVYKCEMDLIISPYNTVKSTTKDLDEKEIVVSVKTTSKDRMGEMFIDKILLEKFVNHPQKVIGIFLNDVQRIEKNKIGFTLVSGLFMVYSKFLTKLEGIYYLDPPPNANKTPYSNHMKPFSELITTDLNKLLTP